MFRVLFVAFGSVCALVALARAEESPDNAGPAAIAAARGGDWALGYARARQSRDPLGLKIGLWLDYARSTVGARFAEISSFIELNSDWPLHKTLQRRVEEAMSS